MSSAQVGTLREGPLHASLKRFLYEPGDLVEHAVGGFVVDLVRGDLLIEVQTSGFSSMKRKLTTLLEDHTVRLAHPRLTVEVLLTREEEVRRFEVGKDGNAIIYRRSVG